ncbi:ATP-binding protein [Halomicrococcus sp. NG-SE-24]|uniref:sensor histidine kinase n=1 Tax=Halomicrococcus sp. NG-SE-24 TaxID=3436928 RepID=UPI003D9867B0
MEPSGDSVRILYLRNRPDGEGFVDPLDDSGEFAVTTVERRERGLSLLDDESFDCVVGDADDGLDLLSTVRERRPDLPYVLVAREDDGDAEAALARGAAEYLDCRSDDEPLGLLAVRVENAVASDDGDPAERRGNDSYLQKLYRTASDAELTFEEKRRRLLTLGRERLGVDVGFVSRIDGDRFEIVDAVGSHELLQSGRTAPLSETYCRKTLDSEESLAVRDAASEGWSDDPAYETYGLGCYIGTEVRVDGELYGTLCFADGPPRQRSFTDSESAFVELVSQWLQYELERRADAEVLRRQNDRLEDFASVLSHDLRNPLSIAEMYLNAAERSGDAQDFEQVRDAHGRIEELIEKLLTLAREGEARARKTPQDLSETTADAWRTTETGDATLRTADDPTVEADGERLQQLLENLFRNAVEHAGRDATVEVGALDDGSGFYVADDGPGIPAGEREDVYDHGYSTGGGTGLGLTIVRHIADAHDWTVSVTESESGGARFEIRGAVA